MITQIGIQNFKCFTAQEFALGKLNVLCGPNASGKSSVVQSLLLAKSAAEIADAAPYVSLNGPHSLELGTVGDILCHSPSSTEIVVKIEIEGQGVSILHADASSDKFDNRYLTIKFDGAPFPSILKTKDTLGFIYLVAERLGPRISQLIQSKPVASMTLGPKGEFSAEVLATFERTEIHPALAHPLHPVDTPLLLRQQAELWMGEWAPKIQIRAEMVAETGLATLRFQNRDIQSEWMSPTNVGFGVSHSLPIVLGGLLAHSGGILIVDSPESHLHPSGQSAIGRFLATVASSGVQVILETHSDHVLNGIRLAVAHKINGLLPEDVAIYNIACVKSEAPIVERLNLTQSAGLSSWPSGFFDQIEQDLAILSNLRKQ